MKITQARFKTMVRQDKLAFWTAAAVAGREFCGPMTARGLCSGECADCRAALTAAFSFVERDPARSPIGLITWKLRDEIARLQEERQAEERRPRRERDGREGAPLDPFAAFLK